MTLQTFSLYIGHVYVVFYKIRVMLHLLFCNFLFPFNNILKTYFHTHKSIPIPALLIGVAELPPMTISSLISPGPACGTLRLFPIVCYQNHAGLNIPRVMSLCLSNGFPGWIPSGWVKDRDIVKAVDEYYPCLPGPHHCRDLDFLHQCVRCPWGRIPGASQPLSCWLPTLVLSETRTEENLQNLLF